MSISKTALIKLRKALPHGAQKAIAKKAGYSANYVRCVLRGEFENTKIVDEAIAYLKKHNAASGKRENEINELLNDAA